MDEGLQLTAGDISNQPPNLFVGDTGFSFFLQGNNLTGRGDTLSYDVFVWLLCLPPFCIPFPFCSSKRNYNIAALL